VAAIGVITLLTLIYTFEGGMAAVIWTDVVQMAIYLGGTLVGLFTLLHLLPGGWGALQLAAHSAGKLQMFDFSRDIFRTYTFWAGIIGGAFLTTASHGTDQLLVQRLLAARSRRQSQTALLASGVAIFFQFGLFLLVGIGLWGYYRQFPPATAFARSDRIFPTFIVQHMPPGISGLLIAAILAAAMSNLSAALNSLSASTVVDFHARLDPQGSDQQRIRWSRIYTVVWGLVLFALALMSRQGGRVVEVGLSIASVGWGAMLGVFLLSFVPQRRETGAMAGMVCGLAFNIYLWQWTRVPFTWYVAFGSLMTFTIGYIASMLISWPKEPVHA
jgi:SSS family transporter